jgi:hypothetical protein
VKLAAVVAPCALLAAPTAAAACTACLSSAFGDQTYTWAYLGLLLAPFGVAATIGAVFAGCYLARRRRERGAPVIDPTFHEETT